MISVIIPTRNAEGTLDALLRSLARQTLRDLEVLVVDSSSTDATAEIARSHKAGVLVIPAAEFDHGGTRTLAARRARGELLVFMTQDAALEGEGALESLLEPLRSDGRIAAAFGRQTPERGAGPFERHLRGFNYPAESYVRSIADRRDHGLRTVFCSNAFAAYRRQALDRVGWFKDGLILGEDMHVCAKLLLAGYRLAYAGGATARHSHRYSLLEEVRRYFDTGVFHRDEAWLVAEFGGPERVGLRFAGSELKFLAAEGSLHLLPASIVRNALKLLGYRLGRRHESLPGRLVGWLSRHPDWIRRRRC